MGRFTSDFRLQFFLRIAKSSAEQVCADFLLKLKPKIRFNAFIFQKI